MKKSNTIYTIPIKVGDSRTIHIETVITKGLYRFSILGINQKESSDARDRIYSALRSADVLNLKSDNRKITVNITPSDKLEYSHIYDLGIALSCLQALGRFDIEEKILVVGELSIGGDIVCSHRLLQTIFIAIRDNIKNIVCSEEDIMSLRTNIITLIRKNNIKMIAGKDLNDIVQKLSRKDWFIFALPVVYTEQTIIPADVTRSTFSISNILSNNTLSATYIALCGGHDIAFEIPDSVFIRDFILQIYKQNQSLNAEQILYMSHVTKDSDTKVYSDYQYPYIGHIHTQTTRQELCLHTDVGMLQKSILGTLIVQDLAQLPHTTWNTVLRSKRGHILAICKSCPCGIESKLFTTKQQRCTCIQRSVMRHQQYLQSTYKDFFTLWVKTSDQVPKLTTTDVILFHTHIKKVRELQRNRYISEKNTADGNIEEIVTSTSLDYLNCYRDPVYIIKNLDSEALSLYESIQDIYNQENIDKILRLSQTLQDIECVAMHEKSTAVTKQTMLLALSYIPKKDF